MNDDVKKLNDEFAQFLKTKGIKAKVNLVIENMKESTKLQHEKDVRAFNEVKEKSIEENKDFVEFLKTKGLKAKFKLVVENIKKGARESRAKAKEQIEASKHINTPKVITTDDLSKEFNNFLKSKGLDGKYTVVIEEKE